MTDRLHWYTHYGVDIAFFSKLHERGSCRHASHFSALRARPHPPALPPPRPGTPTGGGGSRPPCPASGAAAGPRRGPVVGPGCCRRCRTARSGSRRAARRAAGRGRSGGRSGTAAPTTASTATGAAGEAGGRWGRRARRPLPGLVSSQLLACALFLPSLSPRRDFFPSRHVPIPRACLKVPPGPTFPRAVPRVSAVRPKLRMAWCSGPRREQPAAMAAPAARPQRHPPPKTSGRANLQNRVIASHTPV